MTKTHQWYYDGVAIGGATAKTHTLTSGQTDSDRIECRVQVDYGADSVAALAEYAAPTFTPADLFAASETGYVFDPATTGIYTDDYPGVTTAATNGTRVGNLRDDIGSAGTIDWGNAVADRKPLYVESGAVKYLHFDGDVGHRVFDTISTAFAGDYSVFIAARFIGANVSAGAIQSILVTPNAATDGVQFFFHNDAGTWKLCQWTGDFTYATTAITAGVDFTAAVYGTGGDGTFWRDGATDGTYTGAEGVGTDNFLGRVTDRGPNMRLYGLVIIDRAFTTGELADLETYFAGNMP